MGSVSGNRIIAVLSLFGGCIFYVASHGFDRQALWQGMSLFYFGLSLGFMLDATRS